MERRAVRQRQRHLRRTPRRLLAQHRDRLAGRDQTADPLLGQLEEGLDRPDHEHRVPEEADQLADTEPALDDLPGAEPGQHDEEQTGEQHAVALHRCLPDSGRHAGPPGALGLLGVVAGEGLLAADAPQDAQPGDDVGGHRGQVGVAGALDLLPPLHRAEQRRREQHQHRREDQHHHAERERGGQHEPGDDQVRDEGAGEPGHDLGQGAELVAVAGGHAQHLTGGRPLRQQVAQLDRLAVDHHARAVHADQPGPDHQRVAADPGGDADQHQDAHQCAQRSDRAQVAAQNAVVDDPADQVGPDRTGQPLQHGQEGRQGKRRPLLAQQPAQEPARTAGVGVGERPPRVVGRGGSVEIRNPRREVEHDRSTLRRSVSLPPLIFWRLGSGV